MMKTVCVVLQAPARLIANNAGVEGDVIVEKLMGQPWEQGYNAMDDRIENLMEAGIIDPAKVFPEIYTICTCASPSSTIHCLWVQAVTDRTIRVPCCSFAFKHIGELPSRTVTCDSLTHYMWRPGDKKRSDECMRYCWDYADNTGCYGGEEEPQVSW